MAKTQCVGNEDEAGEKVKLKRVVGLHTAIALVIGNMIGSGIFVSPTAILRQVNSVGMTLVIWAVCGGYNMLTGFMYAELSSTIRECGGKPLFLRKGLGKPMAFLNTFSFFTLRGFSGKTSLSLVSADYLLTLFLGDTCPNPYLLTRLLALMILSTAVVTNWYSSTKGSTLSAICTVAKVFALVVIIIGGVVHMARGNVGGLDKPFAGSTVTPATFAVAFYSGLFSFGGGPLLATFAEEVKNPKRNIPLAIFIALPSVAIIYMLTNVAYFSVLDVDTFLNSGAVAVTWAERVMPQFTWFIAFSVAISAYGTLVGGVFGGARQVFSAARNRQLPGIFAMIHLDNRTPAAFFIYTMIGCTILMFIADIYILIRTLGFLSSLFDGMVAVAFLVIRYRFPEWERPYKTHIFFPIVILLISLGLFSIAIMTGDDYMQFIIGAGFTFLGLPVYLIFNHWEWKIPGWEYVTRTAQLWLQVMPSEDEFTEKYQAQARGQKKSPHGNKSGMSTHTIKESDQTKF